MHIPTSIPKKKSFVHFELQSISYLAAYVCASRGVGWGGGVIVYLISLPPPHDIDLI